MLIRPSILATILVALASPLRAQAPSPDRIDATGRRAIIDSVSKVLLSRYVDSAGAVRLATHIRAQSRAGAYNTDSTASAFGAHLMRDLNSIIPDLHLRLSYEPDREFALGSAGAGPRPVPSPSGTGAPIIRTFRPDGRDSLAISRTNFGFARVERLAGNVGYLKLDRFVPLDYSGPTATAALGFLANSEAVIVDVRDNIGGSPDLVNFLLSWFAAPVPREYFTSYNRALNVTRRDSVRIDVPYRRATPPRLYVLTGPNTASAAEEFAYDARNLGVGTIVGDRTAGAGNGGGRLSVGAGLALFVPEWRVTTGPGWERVGVAPDVPVTVDQALITAHRLALRQLAVAGADSAGKALRERALARLDSLAP